MDTDGVLMQPIRAPQKTFPQPCPTNPRRVFSIVPVQKFPGVSRSPSLAVLVLENKRRLTCSIYCVCVSLEGARAAGCQSAADISVEPSRSLKQKAFRQWLLASAVVSEECDGAVHRSDRLKTFDCIPCWAGEAS